jgi:uncharacterized membrane protein YecN with MAPEG domain
VTRSTLVQVMATAGLVAGLAYLVVSSADSWADWVVFAVLVVTAFGAALAVHHREHPTRKRSFSRSSDSRR